MAIVLGTCCEEIGVDNMLTRFYIWAAAVAVSRVCLGRHHVGDVIAGVAIGVAQASLQRNFLWLLDPWQWQ